MDRLVEGQFRIRRLVVCVVGSRRRNLAEPKYWVRSQRQVPRVGMLASVPPFGSSPTWLAR